MLWTAQSMSSKLRPLASGSNSQPACFHFPAARGPKIYTNENPVWVVSTQSIVPTAAPRRQSAFALASQDVNERRRRGACMSLSLAFEFFPVID